MGGRRREMVLMAWVLVATCESVGVSPQTPARPPFYQIRRLHGGAWSVLGTLTRLRGGASSSLKYYRVLGLQGPGASTEEIKKAYKKMALRWHPDRCSPDEKEVAEEKFKEVSAAYETLSDPDRKAFYDRWGDEGVRAQNGREPSREDFRTGPSGMRRAGGFGDNDFQDPFDIFAQFFGPDMAHDGPFDPRDMGGGVGGVSLGRDMFGRSVFHGPGGVRVVVGGSTSPTSILLQMLIGSVENWASRRRRQAHEAGTQDETPARDEAAPSAARRMSLMVPCSLEDLLAGCSKEVAGPACTEERFVVEVKPGWKDGTRVTFVGEDRHSCSRGKQKGGGDVHSGQGAVGAWEVVCVIRELPHALFSRSGDDLVFRLCVTEDELEDSVRAAVPLLGARGPSGAAPPPRPGRAAATSRSQNYAGKTKLDGGPTREGGGEGRPGQGDRSWPSGLVEVVFQEDEFDLSGPGGSIFGRKISERRIRGEGMPIKGGPQRGDMIVELLVGNRLQALVLRSGVAACLSRAWGLALSFLMLLRNCLWLLVSHVRASAFAQRAGKQLLKAFSSVKRVVSEVVGPYAPILQEGAVHVGLFCVLMFFNPAYACLHALSIAMRLYADGHR